MIKLRGEKKKQLDEHWNFILCFDITYANMIILQKLINVLTNTYKKYLENIILNFIYRFDTLFIYTPIIASLFYNAVIIYYIHYKIDFFFFCSYLSFTFYYSKPFSCHHIKCILLLTEIMHVFAMKIERVWYDVLTTSVLHKK
jgi:hypothetical protein